MSIATRASTCTSCGKRLTRKQWYYRNGQYFCKPRCWEAERKKAAGEAAKAEGPKAEAAKAEAAKAPPKPNATSATS